MRRIKSITTFASCVSLHNAYAQPSTLCDHVIASPPAAARTNVEHRPPVQPATPPATAISSTSALGVIAAANAYRWDQITILVDLIAQTPKHSRDRPEFMYRLAEMYAQAKRLRRLRRVQAEIALASASASAVRQQLTTTTINAERQREKRDLVVAIRVYNELVTDPAFATYPKLDQAIFYYGYTLQSGGYMDQAVQQYDALLKNDSDSNHVTDALVAIADYHFDGNRFAEPEPLYRQLLNFSVGAGLPLRHVQTGMGTAPSATTGRNARSICSGGASHQRQIVAHGRKRFTSIKAYEQIAGGRAKRDDAIVIFSRITVNQIVGAVGR